MRRPAWSTLEKRVGVAFDLTMRALIDAAFALAPGDPEHAFEPGLHLWLTCLGSGTLRARHTPAGVFPFAGAYGLVEYSFGGDGVIVRRAPKESDGDPHVIAPGLAAFLGLVALVGGDEMSRSWSDATFARLARERRTGPDADAFVERASCLLAIPGVARPRKPSRICRAVPDLRRPRAPREAPPEIDTAAIRRAAEALLSRRRAPSAAELHLALRELDRADIAATDRLYRRVAAAALRAAKRDRDFF